MKSIKQDIETVNNYTTYKVGDYEITIDETSGKKPFISVFRNKNLITTFEGFSEGLEIGSAILELYTKLVKDCGMCQSGFLCDRHL